MNIFLSNLAKFKNIFFAILCISVFISQYILYKIPRITVAPKTNQTPKVFQVLLWTPYYSSYNDWPKMENLSCKCRNCELTRDRDVINVSDAVLFHFRADFNFKDLPAVRNPKQIWILFNQESPNYTPYNSIMPLVEQINWTMTYRRDSDIYAPYGEIVKCDNSGRKTVNEFKDKKKNVAWIVSNCYTHSGREKYVRELQKYIDVDVYGGCGKLHCDRFTEYSHPSCLKDIARDYKFYLAFENSVVRGGANYSAIMPYNSYIDAFNFTSPQELAKYLQIVGNDSVKYNSYMTWKQSYCSVNTGWNIFCEMCDRLNNARNIANITNLIDWWFSGGNCSVNAHM